MTYSPGLPVFSSIDVPHFKTQMQDLLSNNQAAVARILAENKNYTWENLIHPLNDLDDSLERLWSPLSHLHSVMDSKELRECYEACLPLLSDYNSEMGHNLALYKAIQSIDVHSLDASQQKILEDILRDFQLSGVALSSKDKARFEKIQKELAELTNQFENNVLDATQAFSLHLKDDSQLKGLPQHALDTAAAYAKTKKLPGYVLTLEAPCYLAVMTYAKDAELRKTLYQAYVTRASDQSADKGFDNTKLMYDILRLRDEKARLLGFPNYAALSLATKMAESTDGVLSFLYDLVKRASLQAHTEFKALSQFASQTKLTNALEPWDVAYVSEKKRESLYGLSQEALRAYFPLYRVMQGIFSIIQQLYGMTMQEISGVDVWHPDVRCYCVVDETNQLRGYIYTDLFARPNKHGGAWMDSMQSRRVLSNQTIQPPIATLTCNFAKSSSDKPAMLSHDEVLTLFHELGHCLHHILTQVDYLDAAGLNGVEWDAVELPSQFFENWAWNQEALDLLSSHVETGESLPKALYEALLASKNFQSAMYLLRQMEFSLFDFIVHKDFNVKDPEWVSKVLKEIRTQTAVIPIVPYNRFQHSFTHIFGGGYAAGYYSYIWAEVLSCDAFSRFEEEGILNPTTGRDFLHCILEKGGSKKAAQTFRDFRGRDAKIDALLKQHGIM